jgi:hypothetical protein
MSREQWRVGARPFDGIRNRQPVAEPVEAPAPHGLSTDKNRLSTDKSRLSRDKNYLSTDKNRLS